MTDHFDWADGQVSNVTVGVFLSFNNAESELPTATLTSYSSSMTIAKFRSWLQNEFSVVLAIYLAKMAVLLDSGLTMHLFR